MANTKQVVKTENVETKTKEVVNNSSIDIDAIIAKAVAATSAKYEGTISEYKNKIQELESKVSNSTSDAPSFSPSKRVKLMHMGAGSANFTRGRINVDFKKLFDTHEVRYDIFEEMFDQFRDWFTNFEIVILDKDVREYVGLSYEFNDHGADKNTFYELLKLENNECLQRISKLSPMVAMAFLKFYVDEYLNHNPDTLSKFTDITIYFQNHFNIGELQNTIQEMVASK